MARKPTPAPGKAAKKPPAKKPVARPLSAREKRFIEEYLVDLNQTQAAIRAGSTPISAETTGARWMKDPRIAAGIRMALDARSQRVGATADAVLERWWQIASADPNDLVQYRRVACRFCHGVKHGYQWIDVAEHDRAVAKATKASAALPDKDGGFGFVPNADPHPDCPRCAGEGFGGIHAVDTRFLTGPARFLYAGAKETKDGLEIKLHDQGKALENVARHLGMFNDKLNINHSGKIAIDELSDEELEARIAAYERATPAREA
jgi:phage terminase small subunit